MQNNKYLIFLIAISVFTWSFQKKNPKLFRSYETGIGEKRVHRMIKLWDFFDSEVNKTGRGFSNQFEKLEYRGSLMRYDDDDRDSVIVDFASGLMWYAPYAGYDAEYGYSDHVKRAGYEPYPLPVARLEDIEHNPFNPIGTYAGCRDWRLPTLEEAMSLLEPRKQTHGKYYEERHNQLYLDKIFRWPSKLQQKYAVIWTSDDTSIWTSDNKYEYLQWVVDFWEGTHKTARKNIILPLLAVRIPDDAEWSKLVKIRAK